MSWPVRNGWHGVRHEKSELGSLERLRRVHSGSRAHDFAGAPASMNRRRGTMRRAVSASQTIGDSIDRPGARCQLSPTCIAAITVELPLHRCDTESASYRRVLFDPK